jgi:hypothetical protein
MRWVRGEGRREEAAGKRLEGEKRVEEGEGGAGRKGNGGGRGEGSLMKDIDARRLEGFIQPN